MNLPYLSYWAPPFNELEPGTINVRVPVWEEAIELGTPLIDRLEQLSVAVEPPEIRIARTDGRPLQINSITRGSAGLRRAPVLAVPVAGMLLRPGEPEGVWSLADTEGLRVRNNHALEAFLGTVSCFAFKHQSREQGRAEAATAAELLKLFDE